MIGDGLNDVLSLREAGVGVSINAKSELNLMASDVIILNDNLWKIPTLFNLMNLANRMVQISLVWAFAYNIGMARNYNFNNSYFCWSILFIWYNNFTYDFISSDVNKFNSCCLDI